MQYNPLYLGLKLKLLRRDKGYTQQEMAWELNMSIYTYQSLEEGRRSKPYIQTIVKLAYHFKLSVDELIGYIK